MPTHSDADALECRLHIPLANLHRRNLPSKVPPSVPSPPAPSDMDPRSSREPLLSPASSSDGEDFNDADERRPLYGSVPATDDAEAGPEPSPAQDGVQQADAINQVWSRAALLLAYCL